MTLSFQLLARAVDSSGRRRRAGELRRRLRRSDRSSPHSSQDVVPGHTPAHAGTPERGRVDVVLGGQLADRRGEPGVLAAVRGLRYGLGLGLGRPAGGGLGGWDLGVGDAGFFFLGGRCRCRRGGRRLDLGDHGPDPDGLAFGDRDLDQLALERGGDLGVDLVGHDLNQRLVALDHVAFLLEPLVDGALGHRLAELRHLDLGHAHVRIRV